jgi:hypothetical protein
VLFRPEETETIHTTRVRVKEWGLERYLVADWYRRSSLLDHFLVPGAGPEAFARGEAGELGDFVNQAYEPAIQVDDPGVRSSNVPRTASVRLVRDGHVWIGGTHAPVRVEKTVTAPAGRPDVVVSYRLSNRSGVVLTADFAVETNWGTTGADAAVVVGSEAFRAGDARRIPSAAVFTLRDAGWGLAVSGSVVAPSPPDLWVVPIEVVSASEAGFERTFQGASLLMVWPVQLEPGAMWEAEISFTIGSLPAWRVAATPYQSAL